MMIIMPGFSVDCVETLEEINIGIRDTFLENGGETFTSVPCLNDSEDSIQMIYNMVKTELQGWL